MAKINPELEQRAKDYLLNAFKVYSDRAGLEELWDKWDKIYNNVSVERFYEGAADLFPPETRRACKTLINFADEVIFNADPPFIIKGVGGNEDTKKAEVLMKMIMWQQQKVKIRSKLRQLLENLVKYGFVIVKVPWTVVEKYVVADLAERNKLKRKIAGENVSVRKDLVTLYDNVDFQVKSVNAMYWDYFTPWENQTCIIERNEVSWTHLKAMESRGIYYGVDRLKENREQKKSQKSGWLDEWSLSEKFTHIKDLTGLSGRFSVDKEKYELLECWCNFDLDDDGISEECVMTLADREFIIRLDPNPYDIQEKPYLQVVWDAIEGTSLGMGVPQLCERSQSALNDFTNQIMDNITAILNNMKVVDDLAEIPDSQLKSRPNGIIRSKTGVDAVKFITPPLTANEGLKAVALAKEDIRQVSGATVSLQGLPARYDTTATEYQQMGAASARDVFAKLREIEDKIIKEFLRKTYSYDLQFMSREDFIKIVGKEAAESVLKAEMPEKSLGDILRGDYDFIPVGVTQVENKVVKAQQLINFLNIVGRMPPGIVNLVELVRDIGKLLSNGKDYTLPQPTDTLLSVNDENILLSQGEKVHAKPIENHNLHIVGHQGVVVPPEYEANKVYHIAEHLQFLAMAQQQQQQAIGGGLVPPQEQPRVAPDILTPQDAAQVPGVPAGAGGFSV